MEIEPICPIIFDNTLLGNNFIRFDVPGEPFAKQRPRATRKGRYITVYTPRETKNYEKKVENHYKEIYKDFQLKGSLSAKIEGTFSIPKSVSKKLQREMELGNIHHTKKPDADNMGKICLDGLNGIAYQDDSQIESLLITKKYGKEAKVTITIIEQE